MANPYASLTEIRDYIFPKPGTLPTDDALLTRLRDAACDCFDLHVGRTILSQSFTETYNGTGDTSLSLRNIPVTAISSLTINGITIQASPDTLTWGYVFDTNVVYLRHPHAFVWDFATGDYPGGIYNFPNFFGGFPTRFVPGIQNVVISYTAGYSAAPNDVKQAIIELVAYKYKARDHVGVGSQSTGGIVTTSYLKDVPDEICYVFDAYRRIVV